MKFTKDFDSDFVNCGKINANWDIIFKDLETVKDEQTKNWSIIHNSTYDDDAEEVCNEYLKYGYNEHNTKSWKTTNFDPPITFDWFDNLSNQLPLDNPIVTIHRQDPGQTLPWHFDRFFMMKRLYPEDTRPIWRFLIFLEDWKNGHLLQIGDSMLTHWTQGDTVVWKPGTEHLASNVGLELKWTCNITGFLNI